MYIGLQTDGTFIRICCATLFVCDLHTEELYKDFVVVPDFSKGCQMLAVTEMNELGISHIQLIQLVGKIVSNIKKCYL